MLTIIQDFVKQHLPAKKKTTPSGWTSFNAVCCVHNGETPDTRGRGGLTANQDGSVSYHCFNCNFKTSYQPGRHLTFKFRKFLKWLSVDDSEIKRLVIEAIRVRELVNPEEVKIEQEEKIEFKSRDLPEDRISFNNLKDAHPALEYCYNRKIDLEKYEFYVTKQQQYNLHKRVIVPMIWQGKTIIESLGREVIVVADRDRAGSKMLNSAMEYGWSASFPVWQETCKDINEAVVKYGKLFVLKAILDGKETSKLKIELMRKKLYN